MKYKIKWSNLFKLLIFIVCVLVMINDFICIITGYTFTWFGLFTFILAWLIMASIYDDFEEQIKRRERLKRIHDHVNK